MPRGGVRLRRVGSAVICIGKRVPVQAGRDTMTDTPSCECLPHICGGVVLLMCATLARPTLSLLPSRLMRHI